MIFYDKIKDKIKYPKYWECYEKFINRHLTDNFDKDDVIHKHHIIPRSYLKTKEEINETPENIIKLSPVNHIIAHKLLYLSLRSSKMLKALMYLTKYNHYKFDEDLLKHVNLFIDKYKSSRIRSNDYIWINNGVNNLIIDPKDLSYYESIGYHRGMLSKSNNRSGMIIISKDGASKYIDPESIDYYLSNGWRRGFKRKSITINNGIECKRVNKSDLDQYLDNGWIIGYKKREKESKMRGRISIVKDSECKLIDMSDLDYYKSLGYTLGNDKIGKIMINNGHDVVYVSPEELDSYLNSGWVRGNRTKLIAVNLNGKVKYIKSEDLLEYTNLGWERGYGRPPKTRGKSLMSKIINEKLTRKYVDPSRVDQYIAQGWKLGNGNKI